MDDSVRPVPAGTRSRLAKRGLSLRSGAAIMVAVVVVVGLGGYAVLHPTAPSTVTKINCAPAVVCVHSWTPNGVTLFIPYTTSYGQTYPGVAAGVPVPAVVSLAGGGPVRTYSISWAPDQSTTDSSGLFSHTYTTPGLYVVFANATLAGGILDTGNYHLVPLQVNPSLASVISGDYPKVSLTLVNSSGGVDPWIGAGGSVTVTGTYTSPPTNALYSTVPPALTSPVGETRSAVISTSNSTSAKYTFTSVGYYPITLVAPVTGPAGTLYQNYTWGIYVAASATGLGCSLCKVPVQASPHKDTLVAYEVAPGGALDLDPAADYYSVGTEVGQSIDESLIYFNGTDSGQAADNFVPGVATCVPGSALCTKLYGQSLVQGNNYTFIIDPAAHFYDPYTGVGREVYPSDVMFSIIRAILYTQAFESPGYYVGFDIAGPLVPYQPLEPTEVNSSWDFKLPGAALHAPYNNTPFWTLNAFAINDSSYCPSNAYGVGGNGCITFRADADGKAWPALLQVLTLISADGIQEAGWYSAQGADVPGFVCSASNVDLPCLLPGDTNTTTSSAYKTWVADSLTGTTGADSPYGWDPEVEADLAYPIPVPAVSFKEVGSGPYYLAYANPGVGYSLKANPFYRAPTGCVGLVGCLPLPGKYVQNVTVYWAATDTAGVSAIEAGYADTAAFETRDYSAMLSLVQSGQLGFVDVPTLATSNFGFNLNIALSALTSWEDPYPANIPADAFAYEGLRATLEYAYPYQTAQTVGNVIDGIDLGNPYGGFLPPSETEFYDAKLPWPNYNTTSQTFSNPNNGPATTAGTAAWYWAQANDCPSGPLCDPELASFSSANPLEIPIFGEITAPNINAMEAAWGNSVENITGGAVMFQQIYMGPPPACLAYPACFPSYTIWPFNWVPDYPSPADSWQGAYGTGIWSSEDAVYQTLSDGSSGGEFNDTTVCGHYNPTAANMSFWADQPNQVIPQVCQGTALDVTTFFVNQASFTSNATLATQDWDLVQAVYNNLQLTIGTSQANTILTYAPWIDSASINTNVMIGGGGEWAWYDLTGNGIF